MCNTSFVHSGKKMPDNGNAVGRKPKTCSVKCQNAMRHSRRTKRPVECKGCKISFIPKDSRWSTYCSRECAFEHCEWYNRPQKEKPKRRIDPCVVLARRLRPLVSYRTKSEWMPSFSVCKYCGCKVQNKTSPRVICRKKGCKEMYNSDQKKLERARKRGITKKEANSFMESDAIYKRDSYQCYLCGSKTAPHKPYNHPRFPTLDHVVPISRGGEHTESNLMTACRSCNSYKRDLIIPGTTQTPPQS